MITIAKSKKMIVKTGTSNCVANQMCSGLGNAHARNSLQMAVSHMSNGNCLYMLYDSAFGP